MDLLHEGRLTGVGGALEGRYSLLEQLLLPAQEHIGIQAMLVSQVGDGHVFHKVPADDLDLLFLGELTALCIGISLRSATYDFLTRKCPISSEA